VIDVPQVLAHRRGEAVFVVGRQHVRAALQENELRAGDALDERTAVGQGYQEIEVACTTVTGIAPRSASRSRVSWRAIAAIWATVVRGLVAWSVRRRRSSSTRSGAPRRVRSA